jgi:hypothetical protein
VILATPTHSATSGRAVPCPNQRRIATPTVHHRPAVLAACPEGFWGWTLGSVLLRWSQQGTFVVVALRGASQLNQRLVVVLADHLRLVPPRS